MPNLLPDWLPWIQPAGRLIWSSILLVVGVSFVVALMKPPVLKRPFPNVVGYSLYLVVPVLGWVVAVLLPDTLAIAGWEVDAIIVDLVLVFFAAHTHLLIASRTPRPEGYKATWAECYLGAVGAFALLALAYGVVPHEWMTFANGYLRWGDTSQFLWRSGQDMLFFPWHWPFNLDYPALRDIAVSGLYGVLLGLNIALFAQWQKRNQVVEAPAADSTPTKRSRFGRPLRRAAAGEV
ncbi:MAG: hypothetical protein WCI50_00170 [Actinomycetes bacterium]